MMQKDAIEIQRIYLLKDYQSKGLGQRLLDEANRYAKTKQTTLFYVWLFMKKIMQLFVFMNVMDLKKSGSNIFF